MGHVKENPLKEEDKWHPLVVRLNLDVVRGGVVGAHARLGDPVAEVLTRGRRMCVNRDKFQAEVT